MAVKIKYTEYAGSITDAISGGFSDVSELAEEMREWADNLEEKLSHTDKYERVNECADTLENASEPDVPEVIAALDVKWQVGRKASKKSPYPRWLRLQNALAPLQAVVDALDAYIDAEDEEAASEDDKSEAESFKDELESTIGDLENVEFPDMYG